MLVIDDDPDILALAEVALSDLGGMATVLCESAEAASALAAECRPDVILLDLFLPGVGGREILESLRADPETRHIPVVILTAQLDNSELVSLEALQISGVIKKPFDPESMAETLRQLCANTWRK